MNLMQAPARRSLLRPLVVLAVLMGLAGASCPASAAWPELGRALTAEPGDQRRTQAVSDGGGGAIVVWEDLRAPENLVAQHVLASGELDATWPAGGLALLTGRAILAESPESRAHFAMVSDRAGGAIVVWLDRRDEGTLGADLYAVHVLGNGRFDPAWPVGGLAVSTAPGGQDNPAIVSDGLGGAIVAWMDRRAAATGVDVFAQHVLLAGFIDPAWPDTGLAVCRAPDRQAFPKLAEDGAGGAIATWADFRVITVNSTSIDVFAQHVLVGGQVDPAWPVDGRALCVAPAAQIDPVIVADGAGGAIVAWLDGRDPLGDVFTQHVLADGRVDPAAPANGRAICAAQGPQDRPGIAPDGQGGAIVTWADRRGGTFDVTFAHHVRPSGEVDPDWPENGRPLGGAGVQQSAHASAGDGAGGAIVVWQQNADVFAQHVLAAGVLDPAFPAAGRAVIASPDLELEPALVATAAGEAIATWTAVRSDFQSDVYAQQLRTTVTTSVDPGPERVDVDFLAPRPNPARGAVTLGFALARRARVSLDICDVAGRRVRRLGSGSRDAGAHTLLWDQRDEEGRTVAAGLYLARLEIDGVVLARRLVTLR